MGGNAWERRSPKAFSVPSKKNSVPAKVISVPAKKTIAFPPKDFAFPPRKCAELHGTSSTTPPRNWAGKLLQLPPLEFTELHQLPPLEIGPENSFNYPSNSQNFIDYPPSKSSGRKTPSTTPPRIHRTSSTTPLRNRARKLLQLPPRRIHGTSSTTSSRIHGTSSTTSFVSGVGGTHWNAALKAFPL